MKQNPKTLLKKLAAGLCIALSSTMTAISPATSVERALSPSISLLNPQANGDAEMIKSFSNAFFWSSGVQAPLLLGKRAKLSILYVPNFNTRIPIEIEDEFIKELYDNHFDLIKNNDECGTLKLTSVQNHDKFSVLLVSPTSRPEVRLTCVYMRFREMFDLERDDRRVSVEDYFVSDLVTLRCRRHKLKRPDASDMSDKSLCLQ